LARRGIDSVYVIVGEGEDRESLRKYAAGLGVEDRIYLPGFIEHAPHYLAGFDAFILPSLKEGMPYVLLEAAMVGLPIIATDAVDQQVMSQLGTARSVPVGDPLAIADAVEELSSRSRTPPKENPFPLQRMIEDTVALYD
jgi:glycosyltransferase involved in cell wall biosynthesis